MAPRTFDVGVFDTDGKKIRSYTTWFNPTWEGCCLHRVMADNVKQARAIAVSGHRALCIPRRKEGQ